MTASRYTSDERSAALTAYIEIGPSAAADLTGVPKSTVESWAKRAGLRTVRNEKTAAATEAHQIDAANDRAVLDRLLIGIPRRAAGIVTKVLDSNALEASLLKAAREGTLSREIERLAVAIAILVDKYRLEMGENTGREAHDITYSTLSEEDLDAELRRLLADAS